MPKQFKKGAKACRSHSGSETFLSVSHKIKCPLVTVNFICFSSHLHTYCYFIQKNDYKSKFSLFSCQDDKNLQELNLGTALLKCFKK